MIFPDVNICIPCTIGIFLFIMLILLSSIMMSKVLSEKFENDPVGIRYGKKTNVWGDIKHRWLVFAFRNQKIAYKFAELNRAFISKNCIRCKKPMLIDDETEVPYCLYCDFKD